MAHYLRYTTGCLAIGIAFAMAFPSSLAHAECDERDRELQEQFEQAQISSANDAAIVNMYSKHNSDISAIMGHGLAPTGDLGTREGDRRKLEHEKVLSDKLQRNQQTFDRRQSEIEAQHRGAGALGAPCAQGSASGKFPRSLPGLYSTLLPLGNKKANFIYLFPNGNFFHWMPDEGFDGFDFGRKQNDQLWGGFTGRYVVRDGKVVLRYASGGRETEITVNEQGYFPNRSGTDYVQLPPVDELTLAGTYQLANDQLPVFFSPGEPSLEAFVTFLPDGRFLDGAVLSLANQLVFLTNANTSFQHRSGSGTYSLKNHTLHLRYENGMSIRLSVHVRSNSRREPDLNKLYIAGFRFMQVEPLSLPRLPRLEPPPGWNRLSDPSDKTITHFVPGDLTQGRTETVIIPVPTRLGNPDAYRFPGRLHEAIVQSTVKIWAGKGYRAEQEMTRDRQGSVPSSSGIFSLPDGNKVWVTMFSLVSTTEGQTVTYLADSEESYQAHLPIVRHMLSENRPSAQTRHANLSTPSSGFLRSITLPPRWKAEYNATDKITTLVVPEVPSGRLVFVQITDSETTTSSTSRFHDEAFQEMTAVMTARDGRLEGAIKRDDSHAVMSSTGVFVTKLGKRFWTTVFTSISGAEGRGGVFMTDGEDLYRQYFPTVQSMFAEAARHLSKD